MTSRLKRRAIFLLLAFLTGIGSAWGQFRFGPFYDRFRLTLEPGERVEAAGPFYYSQQSDTHRTLAVPPLFSLAEDPKLESFEFDFLYPLFTYDRYGAEYRIQFFQLLSAAGGKQQDDTIRRRITVFPFYFQQRGPHPEDNYTALLPFYGTVRNRLFRDEVSFVMLPLYLKTRKRDVVTRNYLYPLFHLRKGDGLKGWQLWPLIGREHKDVTSVTNGFGDVTLVPGHDEFDLFWPVYFNQHTGIGSTNPVHSLLVFPFYTRERSPARDSTGVLWPFFAYINDRSQDYREWQGPWPFIDFARGEGKYESRVWPLFVYRHREGSEISQALWPLYRHGHRWSDTYDRDRTQLMYFLYSDLKEGNPQRDLNRQQTGLWPLFTAERDLAGNERFQLFAPIETVLRDNKSVERNWSPLWSVWRAESNATTHAQSKSFLWNLYRMDSTPQTKNISLLFGLFQYDSAPEANRWRLFHIPVATDPKSGATTAR